MKGTQILMHKSEKVATCVFDTRGYLKSISKIHNHKLLPLCVKEESAFFDLQRWLLTRNLATNRKDLAPLREFYGSDALKTENGLSLFDCYWFSSDNHTDWEAENAFDNWNCKKDSLYLMFSHPEELHLCINGINTNSPNLTIPGKEQRIWYRTGDDICMLYGDAQQEMQDYKLATDNKYVAERNYVILAGIIYVMTKSETSKDIERISLEDMYNSCQDPDKTKMQNLQVCCEKYGIPDWKDFFSKMCEYDSLTNNESRELCDIGVLRDSNTLETIGFAKL